MNQLIKIEDVTAVQVFSDGGLDPILEQIKKEAASIVPDISTVKGRKAIASMALKVAKSKTYLDGLGKDLVADQKARIKLVDNERKRMRDTLDELKAEVRDPLTKWEAEQKAKQELIQARFDHLKSLSTRFDTEGAARSSDDLRASFSELSLIVVDDSWGELELHAIKAQRKGIEELKGYIEAQEKHERDQAELGRLRADAEEKARIERDAEIARQAKEQAERDARAQVEAAQRAAVEAEQKAKAAAEMAAEREKQAAINAQRETELAIERERQRAENERLAAESEQRRREADKEHRASINSAAASALADACGASGLTYEQAKAVIVAIIRDQIPAVSISY